MEPDNNWERICRLCLSNNAKKLLFDSKHSNFLNLSKIMTGKKLENERHLKPKICTNCVKRLQLIEEFQKQCLESNKYFLNLQSKLLLVKPKSETIQNENIEIIYPSDVDNNENLNLESIDMLKVQIVNFNEKNIYHNKKLEIVKMDMDEKKKENKSTKPTSKKSAYKTYRVGEFICEVCGNKYNTNEYLNIHKNAKHNPNFVKLKCDICGKEFDFKQSLKVHMAYHNEPSCECEICKKKLHTKKELRVHMLVHNNIRNYICEICSKAFRTSYNRRVHMRGVHSKLRPFQCNIGDCVKAFSENFLLTLHKKKYH